MLNEFALKILKVSDESVDNDEWLHVNITSTKHFGVGVGLGGWRTGGLEAWSAGGLKGWRAGGLEGWGAGGLEGWRAGGPGQLFI